MSTLIPWGPRFVDPFAVAPALFRRPTPGRGTNWYAPTTDVVREGDVVTMHIDNHSGEVHPMHLHGHHAVVLARNGVAATGSQWWFDTLNVADKETYDVAFVADNPGVWMDHCHNLQHAADGMVAHLMYEGVSTPFTINGAMVRLSPTFISPTFVRHSS